MFVFKSWERTHFNGFGGYYFPGTLQVTETRRRSDQGDAGLGGCHRNR